MAVKAIKYGMKGDDVTNLQTSLKNAGYNIDVDGSFGPQTLSAVKDYQKANGLTVDGMVGPQTQAALGSIGKSAGGSVAPSQSIADPGSSAPSIAPDPGSSAPDTDPVSSPSGSAATAGNANINYPEKPTYEQYEATPYGESETVMQASAALDAVLAAQPGAYQSKWQSQIDDIIGRILNREEFSYDVNEDALYKQYAEQYQRGGKMAMQDTMGQAAAMTGGYGSSYASTAGNQAYQAYLSRLNEVVPELYGMARDKYNREGEEMYNQYGLLSNQEQQDYGRYQDDYNKWAAERDYAAGRYDSERDYDYGKYVDDRNFGYKVHTDEQDRAFNEYLAEVNRVQFNAQHEEDIRQYNENMAFNKEQAAIGNEQWQQSFDANKEQRSIDNEYRETTRQDAKDSENRSYAREEVLAIMANGGTPNEQQLKIAGLTKKTAEAMVAISSGNEKAAREHVGSLSPDELVSAIQSYSDAGDNTGLATFLDDCVATDRLTEEEADAYYERYVKNNGHTITDTTVPTQSNTSGGGGGKILQRAW